MDENPYKAPQEEGGGEPVRGRGWLPVVWVALVAVLLAGLAVLLLWAYLDSQDYFFRLGANSKEAKSGSQQVVCGLVQ